MKFKIKILCLLLIFAYANNLYSQINIGKNSPESFSVLQLDETTQPRGLRLSQIPSFTVIDSKISTAGATNARGLIVYDTVLKKLKFWNGTEWIVYGQDLLTAGNGLSSVDSYIGLGTTLLNNTTLNINSYSLDFVTNSSTFSLNNKVNVTQDKVILDAATVTLGPNAELTTTGSVAGGTNKINLQKNLIVKSGNTSLESSSNTILTLNNPLILRDETRPTTLAQITETNIKKKYYAFSNDDKGDVFWGQLSSDIQIVRGTFLSGVHVGAYEVAATNPITLTTGKWIVYARMPFKSDANNQYVWATIQNSSDEIVIGYGTNADTDGYSLPEVFGIVDVTGVSDQFTFKLSTSNTNYSSDWLSTSLIQNYGSPEFFALLIDTPINR